MINWNLIAGIFNGLDELECNHNWDLSIEEKANLAQSFYISLKNSRNRTIQDWKDCFEKAQIYTWGKYHECDPITTAAIKDFGWCVIDFLPGTPRDILKNY